jgi:sterol 3beta-glucosyltransferase
MNRMPSHKMPARLRLGEDAQDDVTAPDRGTSQYLNMNQSIFSMIAAAGSKTDFNARFDESSDSDDDIAEGSEAANREVKITAQAAGDQVVRTTPSNARGNVNTEKPRTKRLSSSRLAQSLPRLSLRPGKQRKPSAPTSPSPSSDAATTQSSRSNPRDAPVLSRIVTAEAELEAQQGEMAEEGASPSRSRGDSSPTTLLAARLMDIFGFDKPETVVAEYPAWLLQSVLLHGYLYITRYHICFFAYLPKKSNTIAKNGYLSKRGKTNPRYNRYWFILKGDVLSYYTDPSSQYFPQGNIDLRYGISASLSAEKEKQKDCKDFSVTTDHRTYYFRADTPESAREWVKSLQKTIFRSHNDGDSVKISLPIENIIDVEESPVVELARTVKIRVIENDDSYAIDEYFFSFFSHGNDVLEVLGGLLPGIETSRGKGAGSSAATPDDRRARSPGARRSLDLLSQTPRDRSLTPLRESVKATLKPFAVGDDGRMSPRMSGEFTRPSKSPGRASFDQNAQEYGRASFDRGRRSPSAGGLDVNRDRRTGRSPLARTHESPESHAQSYDKETDSSIAPLSPKAEAQMSASQILTRSDVFHRPHVQRMDTVASVSTDPTRQSSDNETQSESAAQEATPPIPIRSRPGPRARVMSQDSDYFEAQKEHSRDTASPTLQDLYKAGAYPLQRAGAFAGYLKNKSNRMSKLLATESMSYLEKVSGMWAGNRRHYGENETVLSDDRDVDPEDEEAQVGFGDRFRMHFALPPTEKLQATYFCWLHRVLPLYGKIYISNRKLCFRSMLPGTRTKLILPLKDVENIDKEIGFRLGYHGLVLVIRGYEELFFEFRSAEDRDDCAITLLQGLEAGKYLEDDSTILNPDDDDGSALAKDEHRLLQEARKQSLKPEAEVVVPDTKEAVYSHDDPAPILFDDPRVSILNFKPPASMVITCLTIGSRGDVQPYIALAKGLIAEGHTVRIATHREFQDWIEGHGIEYRPVEGDPAELMRICIENGMFSLSFMREANNKFRGWIDELMHSAWVACQGSDLLIESPSAMCGIHIAEGLRIPYFRAFTMPWTRTRAYPHAFAVPNHKIGGAYNYYTYVMFDNVFWKAISGQVNSWRKRELGLRSTTLDKMQPNKVPFLYNFSPSVVPPPLDYSDWVQVTGYWFLDEAEDYEPPADLVAFIAKARADGKKLVYIGFGSIVVSDPAALTRTVCDSVLKADVRCVLAKGWSDRLGDPKAAKVEFDLPAEVFKIDKAPHDWLFKQMDAAVHHGGAGTTGASLRAGIPTVCKPFFGDQFFFGSRIEDLGVGICLKKINVSLLSRAMWEAVNSERMIVKARALGERIRKVLFFPSIPTAPSPAPFFASSQPLTIFDLRKPGSKQQSTPSTATWTTRAR